ncbi:MAG: hypothetical protein M4D80_41550 [Myxococcota bacterium]|nr:hypothetical protein [Myxococcota bacterium]
MRTSACLLIAALGFGTAYLARRGASSDRAIDETEPPRTPSVAAAPFVSLGYRELLADLMVAQFRGYFGDGKATSQAMGDLAETIVALDPTMRRIYEVGAIAITAAPRGVTNASHHRAIKLLAAGERQFPEYWKFPNVAGQIYLVDLQTDDPKQRREWDLAGALLLESASRKPGAPAGAGMTAAFLQSKFGQRERAIENLRELMLITSNEAARKEILDKLSALSEDSQDEIAAELVIARKRFEATWKAERPAIRQSMYILLGRRLPRSFDMVDLATGGRDLRGSEPIERLEPLE